MKNLLLFGGLALSLNLFSQTTIFQDNFESGSSNWTLNGGTGANTWVVNNIYPGLTGYVDDTPTQPASFAGGTTSSYLHIANTQACGLGICNASFDTGSVSDQKATMTNSVSTVNMTGVNLSFWYLCAGVGSTSYGSVEYSTNGTTWTAIGTPMSGVSTWTQLSLTDPALNNQATLKFRFKWINGAAGDDPAFSVDEVKLTGVPGAVTPAIATNAVTPNSACFNIAQTISIPFNAAGTYTSGNIFTAQLSNASGSFSAPVSIGTLSSTASGNLTINASIPGGTAVGTGYRIRIVSSAPAVTGSDNGSNITVHPTPVANVVSVPASGTISQGQSIVLNASGGTSYLWTPPTNLSATTGASVTANPSVTTTYTVVATDANGCSAIVDFIVNVTSSADITELPKEEKLYIYPNPAIESFEVIHSFNEPIEMLVIRDNNGRRIRTYEKPKPEKFFIADISSGVYSVEITIDNSTYMTKLIIP